MKIPNKEDDPEPFIEAEDVIEANWTTKNLRF
jgi:hypothetical protein